MSQAHVIGVGMIPFGRYPEQHVAQLGQAPTHEHIRRDDHHPIRLPGHDLALHSHRMRHHAERGML